MSNHSEISILFNDESIALPGWRLTPTAAIACEKKDAETFKNAFRILHRITSCNAWWWGDVILQYCEWEKAGRGDDAAYVHYANEWEEIVGLSEGTIKAYCKVANAFKAVCRHTALSWSHHYEVYAAGIKDAHEAQDWLTQAIENKWSKTQLRAALRAANRQPADDESQPVQYTQTELFAAKRWARVHIARVPDMDVSEAERMLADLEPILKLAAALAARVATPPAKESLLAA